MDGIRAGLIDALAIAALLASPLAGAAESVAGESVAGESVAAESVAAVAEPPAEVTGTSSGGPCPGTRSTESVGGVWRHRGGYCNPVYSWSDPRLEGTVTWSQNEDAYFGETGVVLSNTAIHIENEVGAWRQRPYLSATFPWSVPSESATFLLVLDGEGGHDGLVAVIELTCFASGECKQHGFIVEGTYPPAPETASTG
jgi:hypothetical protein